MPVDYDKIRDENIVEYGQGERHLGFLDKLYSDRTHFVFELLQNAEDAGATTVWFELFVNRLEFQHNGRVFDEADVRGICGVADGTKGGDFDKIGKFGIGFKSVYAYTSTPEIHSGDDHFHIKSYVRPYAVKPRDPSPGYTTLFIFPFDKLDPVKELAFTEIEKRLRTFQKVFLLFLRKIDKIRIRLSPPVAEPSLLEFDRSFQTDSEIHVVTISSSSREETSSKHWMLFENTLRAPSDQEVRVQIAFQFSFYPGTNRKRLSRVDKSPLFVYFPTEKNTYMGFLVNGPYRTTPARDNIPKDDSWNNHLVRKTGELIVETLYKLKEQGMLDLHFLSCLPLRSLDFEGVFAPIFKRVKQALRDEKLLPGVGNFFIAGSDAVISRGAELTRLISSDQLTRLMGSNRPRYWLLPEITSDNSLTSDLWYFLREELKTEIVDGDRFAELLNSDFLVNQSNAWMEDFYEYLLGREALWKNPTGPLTRKEILRLEYGNHVKPFDESGKPNAYLSSPVMSHGANSVMKCVNKPAACERFFKRLGLSEPDLTWEILNIILPKYRDKNRLVPADENIRDLKKISSAFIAHSHHRSPFTYQVPPSEMLTNQVKSAPIFFARNPLSGKTGYVSASPNLFMSPHLFRNKASGSVNACQLEKFLRNSSAAWLLDSRYGEVLELQPFFKWLEIGARLTIMEKDYDFSRYKYQKGAKNYSLSGLRDFLQSQPTFEGSLYLWKFVRDELQTKPTLLVGEVQLSNNKSFPTSSTKIKSVNTNIYQLLTENNWIPNKRGGFFKPYEICLSDLPDEFEPGSRESLRLSDQLGFKTDVESKLLDQLPDESKKLFLFLRDMPSNLVGEILAYYEKLLVAKPSSSESGSFPEKNVVNPERRSERLFEAANDAPEKEYAFKERSIRVSNSVIKNQAKTSLRNNYTNQDDALICQVCEKVMPFKLGDGSYYFEAVQCVKDENKEFEQNYLALCPVCAAMYKHANRTDPGSLVDQLMQADHNSGIVRIPITLSTYEKSIRFVQKHLFDLKTVLQNHHK